jgi:hypothetical protein
MDKEKEISIAKDYYVNPEFFASSKNYLILQSILYDDFTGYLLQEKENKTEDLSISWNITDFDFNEVIDGLQFPLYSDHWLLYFGKVCTEFQEELVYEGIICPLFNKSEVYIRDSSQCKSNSSFCGCLN